MRKGILTAVISMGLLGSTATPGLAVTHYYHHHYRTHHQYVEHKRHMKTIKRVAVGAAGGAVVGAVAGGAKGGVIGAVAGAGVGALYDRHEKKHGHY